MRAQAELLVGETTRMRRIVQALLEFLRTRPLERYPTSIRALVDAVLLLHSYRVGPGGIDVQVAIDPDLPPVPIDRAQLQLALVNLVQAAVDAILADGGTGRLRIEAGATGDQMRVVVSHTAPPDGGDDGDGPAPDDLRWLVTREIVGAHGGTLSVAGNAVTLTLPLAGLEDTAGSAASASAPPEREPAGSADPRGERILVLDDERPIRLLLEKWLRGSGYEPVIASTGEEAVDLVRDAPFDAILCDHRMAGMNGTEVFEAVVELRPDLEGRFVFMSGDVLNPQLREFVQSRGIGLLAKPFDLDTVHRALGTVLDR